MVHTKFNYSHSPYNQLLYFFASAADGYTKTFASSYMVKRKKITITRHYNIHCFGTVTNCQTKFFYKLFQKSNFSMSTKTVSQFYQHSHLTPACYSIAYFWLFLPPLPYITSPLTSHEIITTHVFTVYISNGTRKNDTNNSDMKYRIL
jgi:hypothetical protein